MSRRVLMVALTVPVAVSAWLWLASAPSAQEAAGKPRKVTRTDAEWRKVLSRAQYDVIRRKATEPPFSGKYAVGHPHGTFVCAACAAPLFSSQAKFDSGTGWPSFWRPVDPRRVESVPDTSTGDLRVEVLCNDCGGHLGHVFNDGPAPTGLRYCINSLSLRLVPDAPARKAAGGRPKSDAAATPPAEPEPAPAPAGEKAPPGKSD